METINGIWRQIGPLDPQSGQAGAWPADAPLAHFETQYAFLPDGSYHLVHAPRGAQVVFTPGGFEAAAGAPLLRFNGRWRVEGKNLRLEFSSPQGQPASMTLGLAGVSAQDLYLTETPPRYSQPVTVAYQRLGSFSARPAFIPHTSADGLIRVEYPASGYSLEEACGVTQGPTLTTMVKCKRSVEGEFAFMLAKDYTVQPEQVVPAERLVREFYARGYQQAFEEVRYDSISERQHLGVSWTEAAMQMRHTRLGHIVKLEMVATSGVHVLVASMEGAAQVVRAEFANLSHWLSTARFTELEK